jgi:hypothetical protein
VKGERVTIASDWTTVRCEKHDMTSCADCLEAGKLRREGSEVRFKDDCGVATFRELTGIEYDEAAEILLEAGFRPGHGTPAKALAETLTAFGFRVEKRGLGIVRPGHQRSRTEGFTVADALEASRRGRVFYLIGSDRRGAHAWTILDGSVNRAFLRAPYKYGILEVTA